MSITDAILVQSDTTPSNFNRQTSVTKYIKVGIQIMGMGTKKQDTPEFEN